MAERTRRLEGSASPKTEPAEYFLSLWRWPRTRACLPYPLSASKTDSTRIQPRLWHRSTLEHLSLVSCLQGSLHPLLRIPRPLLFPHHHDLANVIRIMRRNLGNG